MLLRPQNSLTFCNLLKNQISKIEILRATPCPPDVGICFLTLGCNLMRIKAFSHVPVFVCQVFDCHYLDITCPSFCALYNLSD